MGMMNDLLAGPDMYTLRTMAMLQRTMMGPMYGFQKTSPFMYAMTELSKPFFVDLPKPVFGIESILTADEALINIREKVVLRKAFVDLLHFSQERKREGLPRVLIIAPMSGHYATLLRDTVRTFLADHEVFVTDWSNARDVPSSAGVFSTDTYVTYVREIFHFLARDGDFHVVAVCQPAVPALIATALEAQTGGIIPVTLTLMGGPIDPRVSMTEVGKYAQKHPLETLKQRSISRVPLLYPGHGREVYPGFLQFLSFVAMNYGTHFGAQCDEHMRFFIADIEKSKKHGAFYAEYGSVMDLPAEYYLSTIRDVFQEFKVPNGNWIMEDGTLVDLSAITKTAVLTIEGIYDDITGLGQTRAALDLLVGIPASKKYAHEAPTGHYGLFSGEKARAIYETVTKRFIAKYPQNRRKRHTGVR